MVQYLREQESAEKRIQLHKKSLRSATAAIEGLREKLAEKAKQEE